MAADGDARIHGISKDGIDPILLEYVSICTRQIDISSLRFLTFNVFIENRESM